MFLGVGLPFQSKSQKTKTTSTTSNERKHFDDEKGHEFRE